ncbi:MAG: YdiU family protein, partial [Halioglobus sp.]|nr:YdiU family protein [Halioglobus sp.]
HGVMNTDNMLLCGETIDYGPCAFMDAFNPEQVFSSIDQGGRYAYRNQPGIAHWNLSCLARALLPLLDDEPDAAVALAQAAIDEFPGQFMDAHSAGMADKLGLTGLTESDTPLVEDLFTLMANEQLDFTLTFRQLADLANPDDSAGQLLQDFPVPDALAPWLDRWHARLAHDPQSATDRQAGMYRANPAIIPRNHQVEAVIEAAQRRGDFEPFHRLLSVLDSPHRYRSADRHYAEPPKPEEIVTRTFCGT